MNYKINQLNETIECEQVKFPDIEALKYGNIPIGKTNSVIAFNASAFCESTGISADINVFMKTQRLYIDRLIQEKVVESDKLFFVDKNNNVYIATGLEVLFLFWISKDYQIYFQELIDEVLSNGIAFSDGFVLKMAMERIPNETLQEVIQHRNEQKTT